MGVYKYYKGIALMRTVGEVTQQRWKRPWNISDIKLGQMDSGVFSTSDWSQINISEVQI